MAKQAAEANPAGADAEAEEKEEEEEDEGGHDLLEYDTENDDIDATDGPSDVPQATALSASITAAAPQASPSASSGENSADASGSSGATAVSPNAPTAAGAAVTASGGSSANSAVSPRNTSALPRPPSSSPTPPSQSAANSLPPPPPPGAAAPASSLGPDTEVEEPTRLKRLVAVLRRLGVPVLELAYFPASQRRGLVVREANEAARAALEATHALRNTIHPGYPISEACDAQIGKTPEGVRSAEAVRVSQAIVEKGEDHAVDSRGRKLRLRWGALDSSEMDALVMVSKRAWCRHVSVLDGGCTHSVACLQSFGH